MVPRVLNLVSPHSPQLRSILIHLLLFCLALTARQPARDQKMLIFISRRPSADAPPHWDRLGGKKESQPEIFRRPHERLELSIPPVERQATAFSARRERKGKNEKAKTEIILTHVHSPLHTPATVASTPLPHDIRSLTRSLREFFTQSEGEAKELFFLPLFAKRTYSY